MIRRSGVVALLLTMACGGPGGTTGSGTTTSPPSTATSVATTNAPPTTDQPTTTVSPTTTATPFITDPLGAECTLLQATLWLFSDFGDILELKGNARANSHLVEAIVQVGGTEKLDEFQEIRDTMGVAEWLDKLVSTMPEFVATNDSVTFNFLACLQVPGVEMDAAPIEDPTFAGAQIFAGRFDLPGKVLTEAERAELDPDGDGFFYVHSGSGDSENFLLPPRFRVTYTGSDSTCAFDLTRADTGEDLEFISGLDGGGFKRVVLDYADEVYITDVIGCDDGSLQFGPDS